MPPQQSSDAPAELTLALRPALFCFAHLRWNFVYQRPQHLLTRAARYADVYFMEEPVVADVSEPSLRIDAHPDGVHVLTPLLPREHLGAAIPDIERALLDSFLEQHKISSMIAWYYTPMALLFTSHLHPMLTVYDCMDQLSAFQGAPPQLVALEQQLFARADVVFTGGRSLYEDKRGRHANVHLFPSSVDRAHFASARVPRNDPEDQRAFAHPRIGFFGVLDERLDRELLQSIAACDPAWEFIIIGPVVKISEHELPRAANIHYLGKKEYRDLPDYLAHWDVAMLPFAQNASTQFISPTKTPEYLAAGKPVVSTPVRDVVEPYGRLGLARIAADAESFCGAIRASLAPQDADWQQQVDTFLQGSSWDATFQGMWREVARLSKHES